MRNPQHVLFDLDGTLIDSVPDIAQAVNGMLSEFARPVETEERIRSWVGRGLNVLIHRSLTGGKDQSDDEALHAKAVASFRKHYEHCCTQRTRAFEGAVELLAWLRHRGIGVAVVTNKPTSFAIRIVQALELPVDVVVGADPHRPLKPDPAALHEAVKQLGGGTAWMVGDTIFDLEAARAASMPFVGVQLEGDTGRKIETLTSPEEPVFESYGAMLKWLQNGA
ncbi:MAG: HAD-IA family hydrolase [Phycisphaerales bacterium]|nr:HAD-IA family hydrolase [Phycisphaerales bacterium]